MTDLIEAAAGAIRSCVPVFPSVAIVLGSGLNAFATALESGVSVPCGDLPGWPPVTVPGHEGRLVVGTTRGRQVAALAGRTHLYEAAGAGAPTFPVRVLGRLGVKVLILTSASGAIDPGLRPGTIVVIDDHLNLTGSHPLTGHRAADAFVDMVNAYTLRLRSVADAAAASLGVRLAHGVYAGVQGPSYETPAEVRALRVLGADIVGMSTVHETIVARSLGMDVLALSYVTNMAAGVAAAGPLRHEDVVEAGARGAAPLAALLETIVERL